MKIEFYPEFPLRYGGQLLRATEPYHQWGPSIENGEFNKFTDLSIGLINGGIVSWSCIWQCHDRYYIGAYTIPELRRQGLASMVARNTLLMTKRPFESFGHWTWRRIDVLKAEILAERTPVVVENAPLCLTDGRVFV